MRRIVTYVTRERILNSFKKKPKRVVSNCQWWNRVEYSWTSIAIGSGDELSGTENKLTVYPFDQQKTRDKKEPAASSDERRWEDIGMKSLYSL